ncbi:MAG: hypothetical protein QM708_14345 [Propioniciclava sp.]|uniref:hypothetical protein n=1 Tax=Propioniciclava sp. TaxID=2038686 RepID=UPI0039E2D4ED
MNPTRRPRTPAVLAATLAAASALFLTACETLDGRIEQFQQDFGKATLPSIAIGECTNLEGTPPEEEEVTHIPRVPCGTPHKWEAYAELQLELTADFPGDEALTSQADDFCWDEFFAFAGIDYEDSELEFFPLTPTEDGWKTVRDRTVTCLIGLEDGGITGTLKDAQR